MESVWKSCPAQSLIISTSYHGRASDWFYMSCTTRLQLTGETNWSSPVAHSLILKNQ